LPVALGEHGGDEQRGQEGGGEDEAKGHGNDRGMKRGPIQVLVKARCRAASAAGARVALEVEELYRYSKAGSMVGW
jgi:hypothetical protein